MLVLSVLRGQCLRACEALGEVVVWLTNKWPGFRAAVCVPTAGEERRASLWGRGDPGSHAIMSGGVVCVSLLSKSADLHPPRLGSASAATLGFTHACVLGAPCCGRGLHGLCKFRSLCFYGRCVWKRSAVWGNDQFAFRLDDGCKMSVSSFTWSSNTAWTRAPQRHQPSGVSVGCAPRVLSIGSTRRQIKRKACAPFMWFISRNPVGRNPSGSFGRPEQFRGQYTHPRRGMRQS